MQNEKIVIVVPYITGEWNKVDKLSRLLVKRAGVPCKVHCIEDTKGEGWIGIHNRMAKELDWDWYLYCPSDYFPGRDYLKIALKMAHEHNKLMVGFNDGKWHGTNATAGLVHKDLIPKLYQGTLLYTGYQHHGSDPDITEKAMLLDEFIYAPEALLVEIDYTKDFIPSKKRLNQDDFKLFMKRMSNGFPKE